uniref:Uncharacterized protein n=1 Tax=Cucumis melo TaxID=3656 RepID=A0A9I9D6Q0_CUCME
KCSSKLYKRATRNGKANSCHPWWCLWRCHLVHFQGLFLLSTIILSVSLISMIIFACSDSHKKKRRYGGGGGGGGCGGDGGGGGGGCGGGGGGGGCGGGGGGGC